MFSKFILRVSLGRHLLQKPSLTTGFGEVSLPQLLWHPMLPSFQALTTSPELSQPGLPFPPVHKEHPVSFTFPSPGPREVPVAFNKYLWANNDKNKSMHQTFIEDLDSQVLF